MVVRHGSFSAASRALDLATSVLSTAVSQLEEELGVRLLNRTTRSLSLTEAGQLYYLRRVGVPEAPESLREHRIIGFNRFAEPTTLAFKNTAGESARIMLTAGAMTDNVSMLRDFAVQGFGLARLPSYMVQRELASGELVLLLPDWALPGAGIYAVTLKRTLQPPKVSAAIEAIGDYLAALHVPRN